MRVPVITLTKREMKFKGTIRKIMGSCVAITTQPYKLMGSSIIAKKRKYETFLGGIYIFVYVMRSNSNFSIRIHK